MVYGRCGEHDAPISTRGLLLRVAALVAVNFCIRHFWFRNIYFNIHHMDFPAESYLLPLVTSLTGIALYLQLARYIHGRGKRLGWLHYVGRHTFSIMMHHQFFFWVVNAALWMAAQHSDWLMTWFDYDTYMKNIYYRIDTPLPGEKYLYLLAGLAGPLLGCRIYERWIRGPWQALWRKQG